jgi:hypothetical protein
MTGFRNKYTVFISFSAQIEACRFPAIMPPKIPKAWWAVTDESGRIASTVRHATVDVLAEACETFNTTPELRCNAMQCGTVLSTQ